MPNSLAMKSSTCGASAMRSCDSGNPDGGSARAALSRSASARSASPRNARNAASTLMRPSRSYRSGKVMPKPSCMRLELSANFFRHLLIPREQPMQIKNSVFLITGGASGLGAATARMAAENGGKVVIADMQAEQGEKLARELGGRFAKCDVASEAEGKAAVALAVKEFGGIHVLVNCAGIAIAERTLGKEAPHDLGRFERTIKVNLIGTFNMIRLAADAMAKAGP